MERRSRTNGVIRIVAVAAVAATLIGGCDALLRPPATHGPTAAPGGVSQAEAIALALELAIASDRAPTVVWANVETDRFAPRGAGPPGRLTWIVRLAGALAASACPAGFLDRPASVSDGPCLDADKGVDVVLDFYSGAFIGWTH